jgi:toxin ParE1/3/4
MEAIASHIAIDHPAAARALTRRVLDAVERLRAFPESGRIPPELDGGRYREVVVGPCRVFYRIDRQTVYILHVMRAERLLRRYLLEADREQD